MSFTIFDGRYSPGLMIAERTDDGYHEITVVNAPCGAWERGEDDNYRSRIVFPPTRPGWRAAWRIARILSHAHPRLIANLSREDTANVIHTNIAWSLRGAVLVDGSSAIRPAPLRIEDREEVPA